MEMTTRSEAATEFAADRLIALLAGELSPRRRQPLYEQIAETLRRLIDRQTLAPGAVLPPEPDLAAGLGVSRQTVNQALTLLARQGYLVRRRGIGTFVAEVAIEQPLDGLYSFIRTLTAQGRHPSSRLLGSRLTVDRAASAFLCGRPDAMVSEVTRLRLVDGDPLVYEAVYLPVACGERLSLARIAEEVLYEVMRDLCGVVVTHAEETLRPVVLGPTEAGLLGAAEGAAAFLVERRTFADREPAELRRSVIRGDRYRFRVHLRDRGLLPSGHADREP